MLALFALILAGCRTTPPIDWDNRIGHYTYDQAVMDFGPPDKSAQLSDGKTVAEWITRRRGGTGFTVGTGFYGARTGVGVGHTVGTGRGDRVLRLTFDSEKRLFSWAKNY